MVDSAAIRFEKMKSVDQLLPRRGPNIYNAGIKDYDKGYVKYGAASSSQPTLIIPDPIYDEDGNRILPGYYELGLSVDRQNLLLTQKQEVIAVIPVFKVEEDRSKIDIVQQPMDSKSQRKADKEQKKKDKETKKLAKEGRMPDLPEIYNKADIEYNPDGKYYLIKYERGAVRAWGAIKI